MSSVSSTGAFRRPGTGGAGARPSGPAGTRPRSRPAAPAPRERLLTMVEGFVALYLEVEAGRRPRGHLAPLMTPMLYARLSETWIRGGTPGRVIRVSITGRARNGIDLVALVQRGARCGAVGLHLVRSRAGWRVDDVALPECGALPLPAYPVAADDDEEPEELRLVSPPAAVALPGASGDWFAGSHAG